MYVHAINTFQQQSFETLIIFSIYTSLIFYTHDAINDTHE